MYSIFVLLRFLFFKCSCKKKKKAPPNKRHHHSSLYSEGNVKMSSRKGKDKQKKERRYTSDRERQYEIPNQRGTDVIIEGICQ